MTGQVNAGLRRNTRLCRFTDVPAFRDPDLSLDDIETGHDLGHGMLHLDPRVDLDEVKLSVVRIHQELDRAGTDVVRCLPDLQCRGA